MDRPRVDWKRTPKRIVPCTGYWYGEVGGGLLISRAAKGDLVPFVDRILGELGADDRTALVEISNAAKTEIGLPSTLLATNWTVDPFGLRRLYDNILVKIAKGDFDELLPVNPHDTGSKKRYASIFLRIQRCVFNVQNAFGAVAAGTAVEWMKGLPYPALLAIAVRTSEEKRAKKIEDNEAQKAGPLPVSWTGLLPVYRTRG